MEETPPGTLKTRLEGRTLLTSCDCALWSRPLDTTGRGASSNEKDCFPPGTFNTLR
jgi:hypothetical protein